MPLYDYECTDCGYKFEDFFKIDEREQPCIYPCPRCGEYSVYLLTASGGFSVPEGALGNAANGYAEYHGDAENFKARDRGEPIPYPKVKK
jgi:putative FmdB family regulatory protein